MRALEPRLDWRVLGFTIALSLLTGIIFGLAPAWHATKVDLTPTLKDQFVPRVHHSLDSRIFKFGRGDGDGVNWIDIDDGRANGIRLKRTTGKSAR